MPKPIKKLVDREEGEGVAGRARRVGQRARDAVRRARARRRR